MGQEADGNVLRSCPVAVLVLAVLNLKLKLYVTAILTLCVRWLCLMLGNSVSWLLISVLYQGNIYVGICKYSRSQWLRGLRRRSTAARLLRLWVRIPKGAWMSACCECCEVEVSATH